MNVRIEDQNLRFKISEAELRTLMTGQPVHAEVAMLDKTLVVTINPFGCNEILDPKLVFDQNEAYLRLLVSPSSVQALFNLGKNRDGLRQEVDGISVTFQVDMKDACHT
ncbi:MAG: hypothetical protein OEY94_09190 [Alphaproteobacteria bacterium]|nr:hypothetical protein [Alphaproteobacteria bacterium]